MAAPSSENTGHKGGCIAAEHLGKRIAKLKRFFRATKN
jgi:hypothetical protein